MRKICHKAAQMWCFMWLQRFYCFVWIFFPHNIHELVLVLVHHAYNNNHWSSPKYSTSHILLSAEFEYGIQPNHSW